MWHYAKAAERGPRVTQIMSAPGRLRARCGLLRHRCAAGRRDSAPRNSEAHRFAALTSAVSSGTRSSALTVWPLSLAAQASASVLNQHQRQQKKGCWPDGLRRKGFTSSPLHWLRHLRPVRPRRDKPVQQQTANGSGCRRFYDEGLADRDVTTWR